MVVMLLLLLSAVITGTDANGGSAGGADGAGRIQLSIASKRF